MTIELSKLFNIISHFFQDEMFRLVIDERITVTFSRFSRGV